MSTPHPDIDRLARKLFDEAADIEDPATRRKHLEQACADNPSLLDQVVSLLETWASLDDPIDETHDLVGQHIGNYYVESEIGQGGMGTVYLGRSTEAEQQNVAIKVISRGFVSPLGKRRFGKEMQIMARLDHPNLARLFTAGKTEQGLAYVVMEYIDGQRIDGYCDSHKLTIRERLELFSKVCSVVSYAHANEVVHRDIKPSNIMVTQAGEPKLIDFGIAKVLKSGLEAGTYDTTTLVQQRAFSIDYASPEQVRGDKSIGITTDVYSLGVVLYELLTGHRAHRFKRKNRGDEEIRRVVCDTEITRPSLVVDTEINDLRTGNGTPSVTTEMVGEARNCRPQELRRLLKGNLDSILLKALCKAPEQRYQTVRDFSDDINNHLHGRPVKARKGAWWKKVNNLMHSLANNLPPTGLGVKPKLAAYLFLLIVGLTIFLVRSRQQQIANRQQEIAKAELREKDLQKAIQSLSSHIELHLSGLGRVKERSGWETAQLAISNWNERHFDENFVVKYLSSKMKTSCQCFEFPDTPPKQESLAASGWVLLAMSKLKVTAADGSTGPTAGQVEFILRNQKDKGWWPIYSSVSDNEKNASTYATAISVLALDEYRQSGIQTYANEAMVSAAIDRGVMWLLQTKALDEARWWDSPASPTARKSLGLSGLVIHVLHRVGVDRVPKESLERIDQLWLQTLPVLAMDAQTGVKSGVSLDDGRMETTNNYDMAWAIIATADADAGASAERKKDTEIWMAAILNNIDRIAQGVLINTDWIAAELLIALRHFNGETVM